MKHTLDFANAKSSFVDRLGQSHALEVDFSQSGIIQDLGFESHDESFHHFRENVLGKNYNQINSIEHPFFFLLEKSWMNFIGGEQELHFQDHKFICLCFPTTLKELENSLRDDPHKNWKPLCEKTNSGLGCGTCREDLKSYIEDLRIELRSEERAPSGVWKIKGQGQIYWAREVSLVLKELTSLKLTSLSGFQATLNKAPTKAEKELFENSFQNKFGFSFKLVCPS